MAAAPMTPTRGEAGQAAIEFVFALTVVIALSSLLYQGLFFERAVYNQSAIGRFKVFEKLHADNQPTMDEEEISEQIQTKPLSEITGFHVLFQPDPDTVGNLKWGPRRFYARRGTKPFDPLGDGIIGIYAGMLALDHYEGSAGKLSDILGDINSILDALSP
jgi:hypothetical protein